MRCLECNAPAKWIRSTQFAGEHPYCEQHAKAESDFGENDSYTYWRDLIVAAEMMSDKGYSVSTLEKQQEFARKRNRSKANG